MTLHDGATGLLSAMGLDRASPGQNCMMNVDYSAMGSENGAYSLQQGRATLSAGEVSGETLPLAVTRAMGTIETILGGIVSAYDDVRKFLFANKGYCNKTLTGSLARPVEANWGALSVMGFNRSSKNNTLWIDGGTFLRSLSNDPQGVGAALSGGAGEPCGVLEGNRGAPGGEGPALLSDPGDASSGQPPGEHERIRAGKEIPAAQPAGLAFRARRGACDVSACDL